MELHQRSHQDKLNYRNKTICNNEENWNNKNDNCNKIWQIK